MAKRKRIIILLLGIGLVASSVFLAREIMLRRAVHRAETQSQRGYWALAYDTLERYRYRLVHNEKNCLLILNVYANAKKAERMEWAAQACLDAGVETYWTYLSLAIAQEMQARDQEALSLLDQISKKFDKEPEVYRRMAGILLRLKDPGAAAEAMKNAAYRSEDAQLKLDAVRQLLGQKRDEDAMKLALTLRDVKTENPEVKLIIARALIAGRESTGGARQIDEARLLMLSLDPEKKKQLEQDYSDVLQAKRVSK